MITAMTAWNRARRGQGGGRPCHLDRAVYRRRNVVERCFNQLEHWHGIATRYDRDQLPRHHPTRRPAPTAQAR
jgi:transposase